MEGKQGQLAAGRGLWDSRIAFWLAACGSAVGLGNLWRFPWRVNKYGGGAFLIAYFIVLFLIGMPLLTQEMALGKKFRGGDVEAYGRIHPRLRGLGLASVIGAFGIVTYYSVIISYSVLFFFKSFYADLPWETWDAKDPNNPTSSGSYFGDQILMSAPWIDQTRKIMNVELLAATVLVWVMIFYCVRNGVKSMSKVVLISMPVPIICLLIMLIKVLTLEGAMDGIREYIWEVDFDMLSDLDIWNNAIGQAFFSLSVCMGVMTAYTSFTPAGQSVATDEKVVAFADVGIAFMSGFVIYAGLGHMEATQPKADGSWYTSSGFGLVFVTYPQLLSTFPGASTNIFGIIFFLAIFLLGIDSAFSMVEAVSTALADTDYIRGKAYTRAQISSAVSALAFMFALVFCADTGSFWLDIVDHYINEYGMLLIGGLECAALGWVYRNDVGAKVVGQKAMNTWAGFYWGGTFLATFLGLVLTGWDDSYTPANNGCGKWNGIMGQDSLFVALPVGWVAYVLGAVLSVMAAKQFNPALTIGPALWAIMGWHGAEEVRLEINEESDSTFRQFDGRSEVRAALRINMLSVTWGFQIKYLIPTLLFVILAETMRKESYMGYGYDDSLKNCEGYGRDYLWVGAFIFALMVIVVAVVAIRPELMAQEFDNMTEEERKKHLERTAQDIGPSGTQSNEGQLATSMGDTANGIELANNSV